MCTSLEMHAAARRAQEDLTPLMAQSRECGGGHPHEAGETVLRILALAAVFFFMFSVLSPIGAGLTFIKITLILSAPIVVVSARRIAPLFPLALPREVPPPPVRPFSFVSPSTWVSSSRGAEAYVPASREPSFSSRPASTGWWGASAAPQGPIAVGTRGNVAVGGGHDPRSTTADGNVIPGQRKKKNQ